MFSGEKKLVGKRREPTARSTHSFRPNIHTHCVLKRIRIFIISAHIFPFPF